MNPTLKLLGERYEVVIKERNRLGYKLDEALKLLKDAQPYTNDIAHNDELWLKINKFLESR